MRPFVVVLGSEDIEGALLARTRAHSGPCRLSLQCAMHPFMGAVLLGPTRMNPLMLDTEPHPPHVQIRKPVDRLRRERHAIVSANGAGQAAQLHNERCTSRAV